MTQAQVRDTDCSDDVLIARWRSGDERAATALVERHASALARFAARLGVREELDEIVQDTFIKAFSAIEGFRAESSLRTWLFTIERRLIIDRRRAAARRGAEVEMDDGLVGSSYDALDTLVADEQSRRVIAALHRLTRLQREVFLLRVQEGRSYREIADILETTEGAARVHYHHAMRAVKEFLHE